MTIMILAMASAFWFGILTSLSPCPLATNIAAISYISKSLKQSRMALVQGLLYTLGRIVAYILLGIITLYSLVNMPKLSSFLQTYTNMLLGPILIIIGLMLLEFISFNFKFGLKSGYKTQKLAKSGAFGSFSLGFLFALSFCPSSAILFFGSLVPLAVANESDILLPTVYGIGTGLPVLLFAFIIAFSANQVGSVLNAINRFSLWAKNITGVLFILVGVLYCLTYLLGIPVPMFS